MPRIGDDIIPSHMRLKKPVRHHDGHVFEDMGMHYGEVQHIIYPDDARSHSKKFIEYDVYCTYRAKNKTSAHRMYHNCLLVNPLAGLADRAYFTLRGEDSAAKPENYHVAKGSKVLVLCVNGETKHPVIIGGLRDTADESESKAKAKDLGHHLYYVFNGVSLFIDKEGQLVLTYGGKTTNDGKLDGNVEKKSVGTSMALLKDGSWNVSTQDPDDADKHEQFIFMDHKDHQTLHQAKKVWLLQVTDGPCKLKAKEGLKVGEATDHMLLGESFRKEQEQLNKSLKNYMQQAAIQLKVAGGAVAGPFMAAACGSSLITASELLMQAAQAIDTFEQKASAKNSFLSKNNESD